MNEQTRFNVTEMIRRLGGAGSSERAIAARLGMTVRQVRRLRDDAQQDRRPAPAVQQPLVAATRDAGFYRSPDVRTSKRWHIATTAWTAACQPGPDFRWGMTPLCEEMVEHSPEGVFDDQRCGRPGCRVWWVQVPSRPRPEMAL